MAASRIAVLIDAENISAELFIAVQARLSTLGKIVVLRAVGDFSAASLSAWIDLARTHAIALGMQTNLGKGKNSADIALTIYAMDLAHSGTVDVIALVTSDRDFTPLALRLRGGGIEVLGFGLPVTGSVFRNACTRFEEIGRAALPAPKAHEGVRRAAPSLSAAERATLVRLLEELCHDAGGATAPGAVGQALRSNHPALSAKIGGTGKLLKNLLALELVQQVGAGPAFKIKSMARRAA